VRMRTASIERSVQLRHPVPDLQSLQGAYVKNVVNLEDRAERMSMGSDIGEEIRKLQEEQKISDSRRASLYSNAAVEPEVKPPSRNPSISSYANSIVEVNGAARHGGYSPAAFIGSPIGSVRSGSWSQVSHGAVSRSMSKGSRLGQLSNPDFDHELAHSPPDETTIHASAFQSSQEEDDDDDDDDTRTRRMKRVSTGRMPSGGSFTRLYNQIAQENGSAAHLAAARIPSDTSFTNFYDQIAGEIRNHLDMPAEEGQGNSSGNSLEPTPVHELSRQLGDVTSAPRSQDPAPPQPPRHSYVLPQVERSAELDGFTVIPREGETGASTEDSGRTSNGHTYRDNLSPPERPSSAASGDTFQQAQVLFGDFDGAHYAGSIRGSTRVPSGDPSELLGHDGASILKALDPPPSQVAPPPRDGMVFYPAPVPRMLNLPQRLSQVPSAAVQARRRTQLLESMPVASRKSVGWIEHERTNSEGANNAHMSKPISQLPAQLRASVFFEQQTKREEVEIKDQSAMNTLEDLLDASARAPVSAFTSHPITGAAGTGIYKKENASRSSASLQHSLDVKNRKSMAAVSEEPVTDGRRRSSFFGMRRSSISSANALDDATKAPNKLRKRNSVTMSTVLDDSALARGPDGEIGGHDRSGATTPLRPKVLNDDGEEVEMGDDEAIDDDEEEDAAHEEEEMEQQFGPPTTLLAELQLRKAQQKQRGRTFQSFPEGMHSTLLELDAVAQLEKQKRQKSRVALAWEDPSLKIAEEAEQDDEDIPLGVLYGNKSKIVKAKLAERGMADWDRPLGLLERRQMEDNEPLSRRRNRLLGIDPNAAAAAAAIAARQSQVQIVKPESDSEHEGETLGQRLKRLKEKKVLTDAIGNVDDNRVSHAFSVDMLSALGVDSAAEDEKRNSNYSQLAVDSANASEKRKSTVPLLPGESSADVKRQSFVPLSAAEMAKLSDKRKSSSPLLAAERVKTPGTPGDEEEETLGQRRARLQREALTRTKQQGSQVPLGPDARMSTMRPISTMMPLADPRMSAMFPSDANAVPVPVVRPTLAPSRSMADLLAAYPSGKNDARKVSNEMLLANLPQGSLLAQSEQEKQTRQSHIQMNNSHGMGFQRTPSGNTMMNGFQPQTPYQNPMMGMPVYPQMNMAMGGVYGNMSNPNLMMGIGAPGYHQQIGMGYAATSQPNLLQQQQPMMSQPNLLGAYANGGVPYQQQNSYGMASHERMEEPVLDAGTRSRVDAWRLGVMPS
jgi:hypothetical protein